MDRIQMTFDDAQVIAFMQQSTKPYLFGTTVLHHEGGLEWTMARGGKRSLLESVRRHTVDAFPKAELIGLSQGLSSPSSYFEYLAVAIQAVGAEFSKENGISPAGVDLALPTIAALFHPDRKVNPIDGKATETEVKLGVQQRPVKVFDPSNEEVRQSLEIACVGGGAAVARAQWSHQLIKENIESLAAGGVETAARLVEKLAQNIDVIMIVEFHLGGIVMTPLRRVLPTNMLAFNCHSVFLEFGFEEWLKHVLAVIDDVSGFGSLDEYEKVTFLETFLYDLPIAIDEDEREMPRASDLDVDAVAGELRAKHETLVEDLCKKLRTGLWGRTEVETEHVDFDQFSALFKAFPTEAIPRPSNADLNVIVGYVPTGMLASHTLLGPIVTQAVQRLLHHPSIRPELERERFDACYGLGRAARLFKDQHVGLGNRFWAAVRLGDKVVEPRRPQRQLVPSADAGISFDLTVVPASPRKKVPLKIAFDLLPYHEKSAIEVEVRMGALERVVVQLFLNGEPYYGGRIDGAIKAHSLGRGEFEIFADEDHQRVYQTAEGIGPRTERAWRMLEEPPTAADKRAGA